MKKNKIIIGRKETMMNEEYFRIFPQNEMITIGSFVFLDHFPERIKKAIKSNYRNGIGAHPHKGIATFTYVLDGEIEHFDSLGNNEIVTKGGIQWMNSGNGIVHDEGLSIDFQKKGGKMHFMQFWVVLPQIYKNSPPEYLAVHSHQIPEFKIDTEGSILRVLIGEYQDVSSIIPTYLSHFLFHLKLQANADFYYTSPKNSELGIIPANGDILVNSKELSVSQLLIQNDSEGTVHIKNLQLTEVDIMLFGGMPFKENIAAGGPFIMNSEAEIRQAYIDYSAGKFGKIPKFELK